MYVSNISTCYKIEYALHARKSGFVWMRVDLLIVLMIYTLLLLIILLNILVQMLLIYVLNRVFLVVSASTDAASNSTFTLIFNCTLSTEPLLVDKKLHIVI